MTRKSLSLTLFAVLIVVVGMTPLAASAGSALPGDAQGVRQDGPTATPEDPVWLAFSAARDALEERIGQDLTFVRSWTYEETEWIGGIDDCVTLPEGEEPRQIYFGWRFVIAPLYSSAQYEVRTSFNYQLVTICDEVTVSETAAPAPAANADPNLPAPVAGSAVSGGFEVGGQITGFYARTREAMNAARMKWAKMQLQVGMDGSGFIAEAHSYGYKILFSVLGDPSQVMSPAYHDAYANYVAGWPPRAPMPSKSGTR